MADITLNLKGLLDHQKFVRRNASRFNVLAMGRRCGKTSMIEDLLLDPDNNEGMGCWDGGSNGAFAGYPVAMFSPTYRSLGEVWRELVSSYRNISTRIDKVERRIEIMGGGVIDFWSLDNIDSVRGRKYRRVVIDEAAMILQLGDAWQASIRPLLVDFKGDAFFMSTPKKGVYFEELFNNGVSGKNYWRSFRMPTSANPLIDRDEIEEARRDLPPHIFSQEFMAEFVSDERSAWFYAMDEARHFGNAEYREGYPVYVSVDFNNDPLEATLWQMSPHKGLSTSFVHCIDVVSVKAKVDELGSIIRRRYPSSLIYLTGDASGQSQDVGRHNTLYQLLSIALRIPQRNVHLNKKNLHYGDSRALMNIMLQNYPRLVIDKKKCSELWRQMSISVVDSGSSDPNKLLKDRNLYKLDMLDSARYFFQTYFLEFARRSYLKHWRGLRDV